MARKLIAIVLLVLTPLALNGCAFPLIEESATEPPNEASAAPSTSTPNSIEDVEGYWQTTNWETGGDDVRHIDRDGMAYDVYSTGFEKAYGEWWFDDGVLHVIWNPLDPMHSQEQPEGTYRVTVHHKDGQPEQLEFEAIEDEMTLRVSEMTNDFWTRIAPPGN